MLFRYARAKRKHLAGLARVFGYLAVLSAVFGACSLRAARAELADRTLAIGRQMVTLAQASQHDTTRITLNGQTMYLGSSLTKGSVEEVLDRYSAQCKTTPGPAGTGIVRAGRAGRAGTDSEGSVVCFEGSDTAKTSAVEAAKAFGMTGELGAFGKMRYAYAKRTTQGNTLVLVAWTESTFNLSDLSPEEGKDVPGQDFGDVPRFPDAHRVLSTRIDGAPYAVNVYRTPASADAVLAFYDQAMKERGWMAVDPEAGIKGRLYEKNAVVLTIGIHVEAGASFVSLGLAGVPDRSATEVHD